VRLRALLGLVGFVALLGVVGCGGGRGTRPEALPATPPQPDAEILLQSATLGPSDVVEIRVYEEPRLSGVFRLDPDGTVQFPMVGTVKAAGMTPGQFAEHLTAQLKTGFIRNPQVTVLLKELNSKRVIVFGQVARPGTFPFQEGMTVIQALTMAGGFKDLAAQDKTVLTRVVDGVEKRFVVPVEAIGLGRQPNLALQPGDIIFVPETWL